MDLKSLLFQLEAYLEGEPTLAEMGDPQAMREKVLAIIISIFEQMGTINISKELHTRKFVFDLGFKVNEIEFGVEVRLGKINSGDISRFRVLLEASSRYIDKLLIIATEIDRDIPNILDELGPPIQVITFNDFINILKQPEDVGYQDFINFIISDKKVTKDFGKIVLEHKSIEDYIISTFGNDFFTKISEDDASMAIFTQNKDILGEQGIALLLTGTTNTGKSSITNVLFGSRVVNTGPQTDVTGEIALIRLKSDVVIFDTPGVGGLNDRFENRTRFFLGLNQIEDFPKDKNVNLADLTIPSNPRNNELKKAYDFPDYTIVLVVFDLPGGFKRQDREFFKEINSKFQKVILIGNKSDRLSTSEIENIKKDLKERIQSDLISIAARPDDGSKPTGIKDLVTKIYYTISENAITSFNRQLIEEYEQEEEQLIIIAIRRIAAKASTVHAMDTIPGSSVPIHQALLIGLTMRLGIDYNQGGNKTRDEIIEAIRDLFLHIDTVTTKRELKSIPKEKKIEKMQDHAQEGAATGALAGGAIGTIGGPFGILFGLIIGALFGATVGAANRIRQFVKEIWQAPREILQELPGGSEAVIITLSFGHALQETLVAIKNKDTDDFDPELFKAKLNAYYTKFNKQITPEMKRSLDKTTDEREVYEILEKL